MDQTTESLLDNVIKLEWLNILAEIQSEEEEEEGEDRR